MKAKGVSFVGEEYYERGARDFGPALLRLIAHKPDIIDTDGSPTARSRSSRSRPESSATTATS